MFFSFRCFDPHDRHHCWILDELGSTYYKPGICYFGLKDDKGIILIKKDLITNATVPPVFIVL